MNIVFNIGDMCVRRRTAWLRPAVPFEVPGRRLTFPWSRAFNPFQGCVPQEGGEFGCKSVGPGDVP